MLTHTLESTNKNLVISNNSNIYLTSDENFEVGDPVIVQDLVNGSEKNYIIRHTINTVDALKKNFFIVILEQLHVVCGD